MLEPPQEACQATVLRAKVVSPVGDAVGLIDHEERWVSTHSRKHLLAESRSDQLLRRREEQVDGIGVEVGSQRGEVCGGIDVRGP